MRTAQDIPAGINHAMPSPQRGIAARLLKVEAFMKKVTEIEVKVIANTNVKTVENFMLDLLIWVGVVQDRY